MLHAGHGLTWHQVTIEIKGNRTIHLAAPGQDVSYTYDTLDRPLTVTQANQSQIEYTYNSLLQLDKETAKYDLDHNGSYEFTRILDRSIDTLGRSDGYTLGTSSPGSVIEQSVTYGYSTTNGRFGSVTDGTHTFTYGYTANSNLVGSVAGPAHTVTNTYESTRNVLLTKANTRNSNNTVISNIDYTVNPIGQRTSATRSGASTNSTAWQYDALGQVTQADDTNNTADRAYQYDGIGNRKKSADSLTLPGSDNYTANALNQYTIVPLAPAAPTFDADGNMTTGPLPVSPTSTYTLAWDAENRLMEVKNSSATTIQQNIYDAYSRKIATTAGGTTTLIIYDGWNRIAEYTGSTPTLTKTNLWGPDLSGSMQGAGGVSGLLSTTDHSSTPTTHFPLFDGNGNITEYINSAETVVAHYEYDPFGNTTVATGVKANDFEYRFSTKPLDPITGLYYYGYRYYDPLTGRWPSRDQIEERGGMNLYGFVGESPLNYLDILGHNPILTTGADTTVPYTFKINRELKDGIMTGGIEKNGVTRFFVESVVSAEGCVMKIVIPVVLSQKITQPQGGELQGNGIEDETGYEELTIEQQRSKIGEINTKINSVWGGYEVCCDSITGLQKIGRAEKTIKVDQKKYCCCKLQIEVREHHSGLKISMFNNPLTPRSDQQNWNIGHSAPNIVAHEIGHSLGNVDEHSNASASWETGKNSNKQYGADVDLADPNNIMGTSFRTGKASDRHFEKVMQAINGPMSNWKGCKLGKQ